MFKITGYFLPKHSDLDVFRKNYNYELPESFIATRPVSGRHHSKLLVYDQRSESITHSTIKNIADFLPQKATLVFNQSEVFPSRLSGIKPTGGRAEAFILDHEKRTSDGLYRALIRYRGAKKIDDVILLMDDECEVGKIIIKNRTAEDESVFLVEIQIYDSSKTFLSYAKLPIPPYIRGGVADELDQEDYQTTYAKIKGSVAAPTAGLHFSHELRRDLNSKGFREAFITLHVGLGTFKPVMVEDINEHHMHTENFFIDGENLNLIKNSQYRVAIGTTTLRTLQSMVSREQAGLAILPNVEYGTNIFLYPGKEVSACDALVTNFHLPESTLLMLVSSLIGREKALALYEEAKMQDYRFFSYGDAMLILRDKKELKSENNI